MMAERVLVADDEPATTELMALVLEHAGFDVIRAFDGNEALERVRHERPDAVLLDVMMPTMDGREVTRRLRSDPRLADTPIALFSSIDEPDVDWRAAGADAFLQKAFEIRELPDFVRDLIERRRAQETGDDAPQQRAGA